MWLMAVKLKARDWPQLSTRELKFSGRLDLYINYFTYKMGLCWAAGVEIGSFRGFPPY
jgi:hypothetical protein